MSESETTKIPLDPRKQAAIIGWLIEDPTFFEVAHSKIKPDWFSLIPHSKIYSIQLKWYKQFGKPPTLAEIEDSVNLSSESIPEINSIKAALKTAMLETSNFSLEPLRKQLTEWMQARLYREGIDRSTKLYNQQKFSECFSIIRQKMADMLQANFEESNEVKFKDYGGYLEAYERVYDDALTTGLKILDDSLVPSGDSEGKGSLLKQSMTLLLAPVNTGKTSCMISMVVANAFRERKILYMTHEGVPDEIRIQMLLNCLGVSRSQLLEMYKSDKGRNKIAEAAAILDRNVTYIPYHKAGMTIEEIIPVIRQKNNELKLRNNHKGYDMLVSDYPALLGTELARGGKLERRNIDDYIYKQFNQLASELNIHVLCAIQTNRQGSIANRQADRLLSMEDVAESWGPMATATNVLTLNRDVRAAKKDLMIYHIVKSRSTRTGRIVACRSKFEACRTHHEELGGSSFWGSVPMPDRLNELIMAYKNKEIPENELMSNDPEPVKD